MHNPAALELEGRRLAPHLAQLDHLHLFTQAGDVDPTRVVDFLKLSKTDVSAIAGVKKASVRYDDQIPHAVRQRLSEIANIANLVGDYFQGDARKVGLWFQLANPLLGNIAPRDLIRVGQYQKVLAFVLNAREAQLASDQAARQLPLPIAAAQ